MHEAFLLMVRCRERFVCVRSELVDVYASPRVVCVTPVRVYRVFVLCALSRTPLAKLLCCVAWGARVDKGGLIKFQKHDNRFFCVFGLDRVRGDDGMGL